MEFSRHGMVLERDTLVAKPRLKYSVKVVFHEQILNEFGMLPQYKSNSRTLSDPGNKGKLDRDEFAVALHLVCPPLIQSNSDLSSSQRLRYSRTFTT